MRLSVLDQSTIVAGRAPEDAIRESMALARHCEALGYDRYWLAEHHASASQAGTAPEILIAAIAATTSRIRVGSAGVMLPHYASLKVAEQFRVLEAIAPGRIDLGLGRAPGSDGRTAHGAEPGRRAGRGPVPGPGAGSARLGAGRAAGGRPPVPRRDGAARRADGAGGVDPRLVRLWRPGGGAFRPALLLRPLHHRRRRRGRGARPLPRALPPQPAPSDAARRRRRLGAGRRQRRGGGPAVRLPRALAARAGPRQLHGAAHGGGRGRLPLHRPRTCPRGADPGARPVRHRARR